MAVVPPMRVNVLVSDDPVLVVVAGEALTVDGCVVVVVDGVVVVVEGGPVVVVEERVGPAVEDVGADVAVVLADDEVDVEVEVEESNASVARFDRVDETELVVAFASIEEVDDVDDVADVADGSSEGFGPSMVSPSTASDISPSAAVGPVVAGAGATSSSSSTPTPLQATPMAVALPSSHRSTRVADFMVDSVTEPAGPATEPNPK